MQHNILSKRAVLFDLDGTLCDTGPDLYKALNQLLIEENRQPVDYETIKKQISYGGKNIIQTAFNLTDDPKNNKTIELLRERFVKLYQATQFSNTKLFPGIKKLLTNLDKLNIPWGIVTNRPYDLTKILLTMFNLSQRVACVVGGDTTPYIKPHPASLLFACEILNLLPQQCIYIGDAEHDMVAGKAAGMATIAALFGYIPNHESTITWPADYYASTVYDILPRIKLWLKQ